MRPGRWTLRKVPELDVGAGLMVKPAYPPTCMLPCQVAVSPFAVSATVTVYA